MDEPGPSSAVAASRMRVPWVTRIARSAPAARAAAAKQFGFDMPKTILVTVKTGEQVRLFNDGNDRIHLAVVGAGGLGGHVILLLARMGIGTLVVLDPVAEEEPVEVGAAGSLQLVHLLRRENAGH